MMNREGYYTAIKQSIGVMHSCTTTPKDAPFHLHEDYEIYLLLNGDVDIYVEQSCHHLQQGHLLVFNDHEIHKACHFGETPYERIVINFNHRLVQGLSTAHTNLLACFQNHKPGMNNAVLLTKSQLQTLYALSEKLGNTADSSCFGNDVLATVYLSEFLVYVNDIFRQCKAVTPSSSSSLISNIMAYVDAHLEPDLSLEMIARHFTIDRYYLSHIFKQQTGSTLYQYILVKKISVAKQCLAEGKSVTETCEVSGFNDYNNFIRTFKKLTGASPRKYSMAQNI